MFVIFSLAVWSFLTLLPEVQSVLPGFSVDPLGVDSMGVEPMRVDPLDLMEVDPWIGAILCIFTMYKAFSACQAILRPRTNALGSNCKCIQNLQINTGLAMEQFYSNGRTLWSRMLHDAILSYDL